jgi:hypothetical protein
VTDIESNATGWSFAFLRTLVENGVTDIVVCPGSRSQSLALLAAEFADRGLLNLHVVLDERAAAFLALGMSIESGRPAVVVTTSSRLFEPLPELDPKSAVPRKPAAPPAVAPTSPPAPSPITAPAWPPTFRTGMDMVPHVEPPPTTAPT